MLILHIHFSNLPPNHLFLSIISPIIIFKIKFLSIIPFIIISSIEFMKIIPFNNFFTAYLPTIIPPIIFFIINFVSTNSTFFVFFSFNMKSIIFPNKDIKDYLELNSLHIHINFFCY